MVQNCLIDRRPKLTPSMLSHRAMGDKPSKYFKFVRKNPPVPQNDARLVGKQVKIDSFFARNEPNSSENVANSTPENSRPMPPTNPRPTPRSLVSKKPRKSPKKPKSVGSKVDPPKKFGRKPAQRKPAPSSTKQSLMRDYLSASIASTNGMNGGDDGAL